MDMEGITEFIRNGGFSVICFAALFFILYHNLYRG